VNQFRALWAYRNFVLASIKGDLRGRFARSRLGALWFLLHPLAQAALFAIILSEVLAAKLPGVESKSGYAIFLLSGVAAWALFAEIVTRCLTVFIDYAGAMKKIAFPRICLPIIVGGSALLNHVLLIGATLAVFLFMGHVPGWALLVLPIGMALIGIFAFGLGVLLGVFNVFARDVAQATGVVMQLWFWMTPIVYTANVLPAHVAWWVSFNPMTPLVQIYQNALLYDRPPDWESLVTPAIVGGALFMLAFFVFRRASANLVDEL
jgi:lipopolysaccharide transport system permease protein